MDAKSSTFRYFRTTRTHAGVMLLVISSLAVSMLLIPMVNLPSNNKALPPMPHQLDFVLLHNVRVLELLLNWLLTFVLSMRAFFAIKA